VIKGAINQRLKFLVENLSPSVRAFSEAIGDSSSNTNNYVGSRQTEPKPEYLAKVINHFSNVNAHWLLTGNGEPFLTPSAEGGQTSIDAQKNFRSLLVGTNRGISNQQQYTNSGSDADDLKTQLILAQQEIEHLRAQLVTKDALIASKKETIDLLKAAFNRPK
jgi:hypothetical protein